jgi:hypothetical protein
MTGGNVILQAKLIGSAVALLAAFLVGWTTHSWKTDAQALRDIELAQISANKAAEAISKITITNTTIRQKVEREIRENPVYIGCNHTPSVMRLINAALLDAPDYLELPKTDTPLGPIIRGDNGKTD